MLAGPRTPTSPAIVGGMTSHITGTHHRKVIRQFLEVAEHGDFCNMRVTLLGQPVVLHDRTGLVTPHRNLNGELDADDLAAQVWPIGLD